MKITRTVLHDIHRDEGIDSFVDRIVQADAPMPWAPAPNSTLLNNNKRVSITITVEEI